MKKIQAKVIELKEHGVRIRCRGKLSGVDGKLIAWMTDTASMRRCNLCQLLPKEYRFKAEYLFSELSLEAIENIAAAILHFGKLFNIFICLISKFCQKLSRIIIQHKLANNTTNLESFLIEMFTK